jgi:N-methylhydantoinase A
LNVPYARSLIENFQREHERRYGYSYADREVEFVTLRVRATLRSPKVKLATIEKRAAASRETAIVDGRKARIHARESLTSRKFAGPAVVTEYSATTFVPAGMRFAVDRVGNLVVEVR